MCQRRLRINDDDMELKCGSNKARTVIRTGVQMVWLRQRVVKLVRMRMPTISFIFTIICSNIFKLHILQETKMLTAVITTGSKPAPKNDRYQQGFISVR